MREKLIALIVLVMVAGCAQQTRVSALFSTDADVGVGSRVVYEQTVIGKVEQVSGAGAGTRVQLLLDPSKSGDLKKGSALMLEGDGGDRVARIYNFRAGEEPLRDGDELVALNNAIEYVTWQTGEAMGFGQSLLSGATQSLEDYFNSEEWMQQKEDMGRSLSQLGADAQEAAEDMQREFDALMDSLETQTEQGRKQFEERLQEFTDNLGQQIEQSIRDGEKAVADSLQQLLDALEQLMKQYPGTPEQRQISATTS